MAKVFGKVDTLETYQPLAPKMGTWPWGADETILVVFASAGAFSLPPLLACLDIAAKRLAGSNALEFL